MTWNWIANCGGGNWMSKISSSPERGTFQLKKLEERAEQGTTTQQHVEEMTDLYATWAEQRRALEASPEWRENNLEWDLRSTDWILVKARSSGVYAQNLYAALCNNEFQRNELWPILKNQTWSCTWRYAGGIIADMLGAGDYIDWYCSGIRGEDGYINGHVAEGEVTDEIRQDLLTLGWQVVNTNDS
jgi:hypothetical protein